MGGCQDPQDFQPLFLTPIQPEELLAIASTAVPSLAKSHLGLESEMSEGCQKPQKASSKLLSKSSFTRKVPLKTPEIRAETLHLLPNQDTVKSQPTGLITENEKYALFLWNRIFESKFKSLPMYLIQVLTCSRWRESTVGRLPKYFEKLKFERANDFTQILDYDDD